MFCFLNDGATTVADNKSRVKKVLFVLTYLNYFSSSGLSTLTKQQLSEELSESMTPVVCHVTSSAGYAAYFTQRLRAWSQENQAASRVGAAEPNVL